MAASGDGLELDLDESHVSTPAVDHVMLDTLVAAVGRPRLLRYSCLSGGAFDQKFAIGQRHDDVRHVVDVPAGLRAGGEVIARDACASVLAKHGCDGRLAGGEFLYHALSPLCPPRRGER